LRLVIIVSVSTLHIYQYIDMSTSLESQAFFSARCKTVGLADDMIDRLKLAGVTSLANLAFFCTYQPGGQDDSSLVEAASKALNVDPVPGPVLIALRRLHYEAHAMYVADLKQKVAATEEDAPKRMPNAERAARHLEQKARLRGICLEGEYECSHSLLDLVSQQYERDELKYVLVSQCTTRDQELTGLKRDAQLSLDSEGQIKVKPACSLATADTTTELKLKNALTRRGIAYDQSGLLDFEIHNRWVDKLFAVQSRHPPPGYKSVGINQLLEADRELWKKMADSCRTGIIPSPGVSRPLDDAMMKYMDSSEVMYYLLPLPSSSSHSENQYGPIRDRKGGGKGDSGKKGAGKKGSGKKGYNKDPVNAESFGWPPGSLPKMKDGTHFCFSFNSRKGCKYAKPGSRCKNGMHLCAKFGCEQKHSAVHCKGGGGGS
jgi:hypothetical protein